MASEDSQWALRVIDSILDDFGLSREEIAARIGCSLQSLYNWQWGRNVPRIRSRRRLRALLTELKRSENKRQDALEGDENEVS